MVVQLFAITGNLPDAEDAVQEAFARASVHWGRVRAYQLPEAWVRRVALNVAFTGLRRTRRVLEVLTRADPPPAPPLPGASLELVERWAGWDALASQLVDGGEEVGSAQPDVQPVSPPPTTGPAVVTSTTTAPATTTTAPATTGQPTTSAAPRPTGTVVLRADGLGVVAFGTAEQAAMRALRGGLGPPAERGSWSGATPFGICPGPVRAVRWGRLYVLFTNGPTRYSPEGRWHLFAWQVDQVQRTAIEPQYSGPTPPRPAAAARLQPQDRHRHRVRLHRR